MFANIIKDLEHTTGWSWSPVLARAHQPVYSVHFTHFHSGNRIYRLFDIKLHIVPLFLDFTDLHRVKCPRAAATL